jgi:hypothetical protein
MLARLLLSRSLLAAALAAIPSIAAAAAPPPDFVMDGNGAHHITFSTPAVYELTSQFSHTEGDGITLSRVILHHPSGWLIGEGHDYGGLFDIHHDIEGKVTAARGITHLKETTQSAGSIDTTDREQYVAVTKVKATISGDAYDAKYVGTIATRLCLKTYDPIVGRMVKECVKHAVPQTLDYSSDGLWTIVLRPLARFGKEFFGTATIWLGEETGQGASTAEMTVEGKIARDGFARLRLTPSGDYAAGSLDLTVILEGGEQGEAPTLVSVHRVKGKLLGQKFDATY